MWCITHFSIFKKHFCVLVINPFFLFYISQTLWKLSLLCFKLKVVLQFILYFIKQSLKWLLISNFFHAGINTKNLRRTWSLGRFTSTGCVQTRTPSSGLMICWRTLTNRWPRRDSGNSWTTISTWPGAGTKTR